MGKKSANLLHLIKLSTGGTEAEGLIFDGGSNERLVIPEAHGMCHRRVPFREEILKLVNLEIV